MIIEFALTFTLTLPNLTLPVVPAQFTEPVQHVVTYPAVGVLNQITGLALPAETQEAYEQEFLEGTAFYGAFAISKDFAYGYVVGANSIEAAREVALAQCLTVGGRCTLYAEIMPEGHQPLSEGQVSLSALVSDRFENPSPEWGSFRAFAISEDGAYSATWNFDTQREADQAALADCEQHRTHDVPNLRDMPCILLPFN